MTLQERIKAQETAMSDANTLIAEAKACYAKDTPAPPAQSLYDAITQAGICIDHHESDLYFPVTDKSTAILERFPTEKQNSKVFADQRGGGAPWFDVPFAYTPFWLDKQGVKGA